MPFDATPIPAVTTTLMNARQKLVECGWIQNRMRARNGTCAFGAILASLYNCDIEDPEHFLQAAIRETRFDGNIPDFNDNPGRTLAEMLAVFDRAIELSWTA